MATQTFTVTNMQAINPAAIQVQQNTSQSGQEVQTSQSQVVTSQSQQKTVQQAVQQAVQATSQPTIIQPAGAHSGQQFIVTIQEPSGEHQVQQVQVAEPLQQTGTGQVVYQPHQYVEGSSDPAIYAASNGQMQYTDYSQTAMYAPVGGTYYQTTGGTQIHGLSSTQMGQGLTQMGLQGQVIGHQGGTYLIQGGTMDGEGHPLTHTTRASPATDMNADNQRMPHFDVKSWQKEVQWLIDNYETAEGVSLPRSTLYNHYLRHCSEQKMDPMNPASFGKLIRSVFLGLRTRRLGTRGNSKYHYYGIRIKATSPLNQYTDDLTMPMRNHPSNAQKRFKPSMGGGHNGDGSDGGGQAENSQQHQHQQFLGDASAAIPNLGNIEMGPDPMPDGLTEEHLRSFEELYIEHCEACLDIVVNLQFSLIEALWQSFWRTSTEPQQTDDIEMEQRLPKDSLYAMCKLDTVQTYVRKSDYAFYQALVEVLIPDVLRPIPSALTQAIRNFAKSLEGWLKNSMTNVPDEMLKTKLGAVSAFAQTLRRYTSLNHLAQAARAVLQNTQQINQMLTDLNRVDFANVQEQASWVCQCDDTIVHQLEQDFKKTLQQQNSLEQWAQWLEGVVNQVLKSHEGRDNFPKAARQFLLKWSFYSSMVIRDLTLRSAASFGSFHLIRLLYDEYMFYLVEHKVAAATGETPIAVMGEFIDLGSVLAIGTLENEQSQKEVSDAIASINAVPSIKQPIVVTPSIAGKVTTVTLNHNGTASSSIGGPVKLQATSLAKLQTVAFTQAGQQSKLQSVAYTQQMQPKIQTVTYTQALGSKVVTHPKIQTVAYTQAQPKLQSVSQVIAQAASVTNNPTTVTVLAAPTSGGTPTKTIVVVPVSATSALTATAGSGDAQPTVKRLKTA